MTVWTVPAQVLRVVDGDTCRLRLDLGWHIYLDANVRILGVDAPEVSTKAGREARDWAAGQLPAGLQVVFASHELDKYGRPLGRLSYPRAGPGAELEDFGAHLLAAGHAAPYDGGPRG